MKLKNQKIVITGGTSGIGYSLVQQLQRDNQVIVVARSDTKLQELSANFDNLRVYQADLLSQSDVDRVAQQITRLDGTVDVLINNATVQYEPTFLDHTFRIESIEQEITTNFTSLCRLTCLLLPALLKTTPSVIMNVNSALALAPKTSSAVYCATKGAVNIFSQSLRYQLEATNVRVQQAFLELVDTRMTRGRGTNKMTADEAAAQIIKSIGRNTLDLYVGKVKLLKWLLRIAPSLAANILKRH